jgi:hypothetical protein
VPIGQAFTTPSNWSRKMWSIDNRTPYQIERAWGRDADGVHEWIVAVKGTFDIRADGSLALAEEQLAPLLMAQYHGKPGLSSLRYDADVVTSKPTTDVVLNGTAYAPGGRPSTEFTIGMVVGPVRKALRVRGDRRWERGTFGAIRSACEAVTQVPLVYERAYGGYDHADPDPAQHCLDTRNPVGVGVVSKGPSPGQALPNFEYLNGSLDKAGPAGLGPIDSCWSPRREFLGTYDEAWQRGRYPLLPADWDARSLLCSPADQQPSKHLRGGERVELTNLTPSGRLSFSLPRVRLRFSTLLDGQTEEHLGQLATVIIEPDHPRVLMVWQSSLLVRTNGDYLERTVVSEKVVLS